ncbi:MAG TPA: hypothetical protein VFN68_13550 [Acidimicrobiales bacterium]|nr:hypothetical protein [Acidimicrobiales bacterium]
MTKKKRAVGKAAGAPTALVAAAAAKGRGGRRGRGRSVSDLPAAVIGVPGSLARHLPGGHRSGLARITKRRRGPSVLKVARHAGTALSAIGFASDLLAQINALSEATRRPDPPEQDGPSPGRSASPRPRGSGSGRERARPSGEEPPLEVPAANGSRRSTHEERP